MEDDKTIGLRIKDRLMDFLKAEGLTKGWLEKRAYLGNAYFRNSTGGFSAIKLAEISRVCPRLNLNWLITGQGEMIRPVEKGDMVMGDKVEQHQAPGGGPQLGKVGEVKVAAKVDPEIEECINFITKYNTVEMIDEVAPESVPTRLRPIVQGIKNRKSRIADLQAEAQAAIAAKDKAEAENKTLTQELLTTKQQVIDVLMQKQTTCAVPQTK